MHFSSITLLGVLFSCAATNAEVLADVFSLVNITPLTSQNRLTQNHVKNNAVPSSYIVQLHHGASLGARDSHLDAHAHFHKRADEASISYSTNFEYKNPDLFYGLSIKLNNPDDLAKLPDLDSVASVYPVRRFARPEAVSSLSGSHHDLKKRFDPDVNSPLQMTGVDKLHRRGIKGKGAKIAIIDSGVDYTLKALGGCFGKGCKISFGYDLVGDDYGQTDVLAPDPDPLVKCASGGHGTHVAGIIAMEEKDGEGFGLQGVAPEAEVGMYRIFGCDSATTDDVMIAAIDMAIQEKVDVISMSVGSLQSWQTLNKFDPLLAAIDNVAALGVGFIAAAGNNGDSGLFTLNSPGVARGAVGVGYVENSQWQTTYQATDSVGNTIHYGSVFPVRNATVGLEIILLGNGTVVSQQDCVNEAVYAAAASKVADFSKVALAIRRGGFDKQNIPCSLDAKIDLATTANFTNIVILPDTTNPDLNYLGQTLTDPLTLQDGSLAQVISIAADASKVFDSLSGPVPYKLFFNNTSYTQTPQVDGRFIGNYSSVGPTYEFNIKPDIAAPGGSILSTWPSSQGGYAILTGTSMATPHITGVYALIKSQNPSLNRDDIIRILQTSATPVQNIYAQDVPESVAAQGGGMVNAFAAVLNTFSVSPRKMELFGTESLTTQTITISNPSNATATYQIAHDPAGLMYFNAYPDVTGWANSAAAGAPNLPIYATAKLSSVSINILAGQSSTIQVTFQPPTGLNEDQIPIYSGFISITSATETHSIPYLGAAYDRYSATYLETNTPRDGVQYPYIAPYSNHSNVDTGILVQNFTQDLMTIGVLSYQPTFSGRFDIVPADTPFTPDSYGYDPSIKYNTTVKGQPVVETYAGLDIVGTVVNLAPFPPAELSFTWFGGLGYANNTGNLGRIRSGDYRLVVRYLRNGGVAEKEKDYQSWMSGIIRVVG